MSLHLRSRKFLSLNRVPPPSLFFLRLSFHLSLSFDVSPRPLTFVLARGCMETVGGKRCRFTRYQLIVARSSINRCLPQGFDRSQRTRFAGKCFYRNTRITAGIPRHRCGGSMLMKLACTTCHLRYHRAHRAIEGIPRPGRAKREAPVNWYTRCTHRATREESVNIGIAITNGEASRVQKQRAFPRARALSVYR